jgi:hypothetical protein
MNNKQKSQSPSHKKKVKTPTNDLSKKDHSVDSLKSSKSPFKKEVAKVTPKYNPETKNDEDNLIEPYDIVTN